MQQRDTSFIRQNRHLHHLFASKLQLLVSKLEPYSGLALMLSLIMHCNLLHPLLQSARVIVTCELYKTSYYSFRKYFSILRVRDRRIEANLDTTYLDYHRLYRGNGLVTLFLLSLSANE